jgi:hypothetical protein
VVHEGQGLTFGLEAVQESSARVAGGSTSNESVAACILLAVRCVAGDNKVSRMIWEIRARLTCPSRASWV